MLGSVLPTEAIAEPLAQQIVAKAQGNPFFLEEIAQTLVEQGELRREGGTALPPALQLPATVQEVLGARIDRLPANEKALLQTLAVIGHKCSRRLFMQIVAQPEAEVSQRLSSLQSTELLYEQPAAPEPTVSFKHILTQEVAYHSLSQARQRALHERTAQAIEGLYSERLAEHYNELAYHYSRSDNAQKAVVYLQRAGQQAADRSSYREAITHLTRGWGCCRISQTPRSAPGKSLIYRLPSVTRGSPPRVRRLRTWNRPSRGHERSASSWGRRHSCPQCWEGYEPCMKYEGSCRRPASWRSRCSVSPSASQSPHA